MGKLASTAYAISEEKPTSWMPVANSGLSSPMLMSKRLLTVLLTASEGPQISVPCVSRRRSSMDIASMRS